MKKISTLLLPLLAFCDAIVALVPQSKYLKQELFTVCPRDRSKHVIKLNANRPAIFYLESELDPDMEFLCHLELEAPSVEFGFHVYIAEMNLLGSEQDGNCRRDFVQFGRDDYFITTHRSNPYCGQRRPLNVTGGHARDVFGAYDKQHLRLYVENRDYEMDFWLKLSGDRPSDFRRNLTVVVTVFKKFCDQRGDRLYARCKNSNVCVKRDLFCDGFVNCAWPDGDVPTDELNCENFNYNSFTFKTDSSSGVFSVKNVPILIVGAIVVIGLCVAFVIALKTFLRSVKRPLTPETPTHRERHRYAEEALELNPPRPTRMVPPTAPTDPASSPSATAPSTELPPSYDEVVSRQQSVNGDGDQHRQLPADPPPYSPTA